MTESPPGPTRRRRGLRVSLRVFLVLVLVAGGWLGWKADKARRTRRAIAEIQRRGGSAYYDFQLSRINHGFGLELGAARPEPRWLRALLGPEFFHEIHYVKLGPGFLADDAPARIDDVTFLADFGDLRQLDLDLTGVGDDVLKKMPPLRQLTTLSVSEPRVTDTGLAWIVECRDLHELHVSAPRAGDATARRIGQLVKLKQLRLSLEGMTEAGIEALAPLRSLNDLEVYGTNLGDRSLAAVGGLGDLRFLALSGISRMSNEGFARLGNLRALTSLVLRGPALGGWDGASLAGLPALWTVHLADAEFGPSLFSAWRGGPNLKHLSIATATVQDGAVDSIAAIRSLTVFHVLECDISPEAVSRFSKLRPEVQFFKGGNGRPSRPR